jgi:CBS domain-containing protein
MKNTTTPISFIIKKIQQARTLEALCQIRNDTSLLILSLINKETPAKQIIEYNSLISDEITIALIKKAVKQLGKPPVDFTFIALGSEGRQEQSLKTDQDNAIIYKDPEINKEKTHHYFLTLGEYVCDWLNKVGYPPCIGHMMANNPEWNQPLSIWKDYFHKWMTEANPETLLKTEIFFDFRRVYGNQELAQTLRTELFNDIHNRTPFYWQMIRVMLQHKVPLGFFGQFKPEHIGKHQPEISIKKALIPIIEFARIYALKHGIRQTNTHTRLTDLHHIGILNQTDYQNISKTWEYLTMLRLKQQAKAISNHHDPDNYVNPSKLSKSDQVMLKEAFSIIDIFQKKMSLDFTGTY